MANKTLYREFEHTGDVGIEIEAATRPALFAQAVVAIARLMVEKRGINGREQRTIAIAADSDADLMHDLLAKALNLFLADGFIWRDGAVEERGSSLVATLTGEPYDPKRHRLLTEIKAVTYHQLKVEHADNQWRARIVFDI